MKFELSPSSELNLTPVLDDSFAHWKKKCASTAYASFRAAKDELTIERKAGRLTAVDWHYVIAVLNACGMFNHAKLVTRYAFADHATDAELAWSNAWDLAADGHLYECQNVLSNTASLQAPGFQPIVSAIHVYNFSVSGWRTSASEAQAKATELAGNCPQANYVLSRAASHRSEWQLATEFGRRAVELAPKWARARCALSDSLLGMGLAREATELLDELPGDAVPFFSFGFTEAFASEAIGNRTAAINRLKRLLDEWPIRSRYQRMAARQLALLLTIDNRDEEATRIILDNRVRNFPVERNDDEGKRKFISLPLISQAHNHCVPTVAAMVAEAQGVPASPMEFAEQMCTRNGTPIWRMNDFMKTLGFQAVCVQPTLAVVEYFIDRGVPLIGSLNGLFSSHVEVVCGYDTGLGLIHLRDPMHWYGRSLFIDKLEERYYESSGLWALIRQSPDSNAEVPDEFRNPICEAYVELARAVANGQRCEAESAFAKIPDDHAVAMNRNSCAHGVVLTQDEFQKQIESFVDWDAEPLRSNNVRAILMSIDAGNADRVIDMAHQRQEKFGAAFTEYIVCQCLVAKQEWNESRTRLSELGSKYPAMETVWRMLATVEAQLGNADRAEELVRLALDIAPDDVGLNRRLLEQKWDEIPHSELLRRAQELVGLNPDDTQGYWLLADVLADCDDGLKYEAAMKDVVKYFPRHAAVYERLAEWYSSQGRSDLAIQILEQGRELVGLDELPLQYYEPDENQSEELDKTAEPPGTDGPKNVSPDSGIGDESTYDRQLNEFSNVFQQILEKSEGMTATEILALPEAAELVAKESKRELMWEHSTHFRSFLVFRNVSTPVSSLEHQKQLIDELESLLPTKNLPGVPEHYAKQFLGRITELQLEGQQAALLLNWLETHCHNVDRYPGLEFEKAFLQELVGRTNEAEQTLDNISKRYPEYSAAWFRKAKLAISRQDFSAAIENYEKSIEVSPALLGAISELISLFEYLNDSRAQAYRDLMVRLRPYSLSAIFSAALGLTQSGGVPKDAIEYLESKKSFIRPEDYPLSLARLHTDLKEFDQAMEIVSKIGDVREDRQVMLRWIKVDCLVANEKYDEAIVLLEELIEADPNDEDAIDQIVRLHRERAPEKAVEFAKDRLKKGSGSMILAYVVCQYSEYPSTDAILTVKSLEDGSPDATAFAFYEALNRPGYMNELLAFLIWCDKNLPHLVDLRETLAFRYNIAGQTEMATRVARSLLNKDPDNPRWLELLGGCIQDADSKLAIEYLNKAFELTGSASTLVQIGRAYQISGKHREAKKHYLDSLKINPHETLAITNLVYEYKMLKPHVFDCACQALEQGHGAATQYFHVAAVKLARKLKRTLPESWFRGALERYELVLGGDAFDDEKTKLRRSIVAWAAECEEHDILTQHAFFWDSWFANWRFPGSRWIPKPTTNSNNSTQ